MKIIPIKNGKISFSVNNKFLCMYSAIVETDLLYL